MATERQIEANRRNAARSTGPKTDDGKARSRANATVHGLAGESAPAGPALSAAFEARRQAWSKDFRPSGEAANWALDRAVAASLRIEQCERAVEGLVESGARRARLAWDQDREVEAAALASGLARSPALVSRKLAATRQGAAILIAMWERSRPASGPGAGGPTPNARPPSTSSGSTPTSGPARPRSTIRREATSTSPAERSPSARSPASESTPTRPSPCSTTSTGSRRWAETSP